MPASSSLLDSGLINHIGGVALCGGLTAILYESSNAMKAWCGCTSTMGAAELRGTGATATFVGSCSVGGW